MKIKKDVTYEEYKNKDGIVLLKDGWGATDHIDISNGHEVKADYSNYFLLANEVWFWDLK